METLQKLGLSKSEIKVYLSLLQENCTSAGELTKHCGLYRTNIYDTLEKLREKGLVTSITKNNKKCYSASKPNKLKILLDNKKEEILELEKEISKVVENLSEKSSNQNENYPVKVFTGKNGVKAVMEEVLEDKKPIFVFGAEAKFEKLFPIYFNKWITQIYKSRIKIKAIYNENVRELREKKSIAFGNFKYIENLENPATTQIFGDKVSIIHWQEIPLVIQINNNKIARSYMNVFNFLWKAAKR